MEPLRRVGRALSAACARLGAKLTAAPSLRQEASKEERLEQCHQAFAQFDTDGAWWRVGAAIRLNDGCVPLLAGDPPLTLAALATGTPTAHTGRQWHH